METLKGLVAQHRWTRNGTRVNVQDASPEHITVDACKRRWLKKGPYSNTLRDPQHPIVQHIQTLYPWANCVCLNRKRASSPPMCAHRDKHNESGSMICFWGDYEGGGDLCMEDGTRYGAKETWHGPYDGHATTHWVTPHASGTRYSAVAFSGPPAPTTG